MRFCQPHNKTLPLLQTLIKILHDRGEEIFDDAAFAGFDFGGDAHSGLELNNLSVRFDFIIQKCQPGIKHQPELFILYRIARDIADFAFYCAVFGERKTVDFDFHVLLRPHKANIFVQNLHFRLKLVVFRHQVHNRLGGFDHAAFGVINQLLHITRQRRLDHRPL